MKSNKEAEHKNVFRFFFLYVVLSSFNPLVSTIHIR